MKFRSLPVLLTLFCVLPTVEAFAAFDVMESIRQRSSQRKEQMWTLADWLASKEKVKLMDLWLAQNTKNQIATFFIGGGSGEFETTSSLAPHIESSFDRISYELGLELSFVTLRAEKQEMVDAHNWFYEASLRILGASLQSTHLALQYGQRHQINELTDEKFKNSYAGAKLDMYLLSVLGVTGEYRKYFEAKSDSSNEQSGSGWKVGPFIEWGVLRIFAHWSQESWDYRFAAGATSSGEVTGLHSGLQLYF